MVLKPAPQTPLCSLLLAECIQQAGWPDGGLNVLPLSNDDASLLVTDEPHQADQLHRKRARRLGYQAPRGKKKVALELGGNAGAIVHSDADLAYAADRCVTGGFGYAGQTCISVQRILVEQSVYGKFTDFLVDGVKQLRTGDPMEESTDVGPLIRESDAIRVTNWIDEAVRSAPTCCAAVAAKLPSSTRRYDRHQARYEGELSGNFWSRRDRGNRTRILMKPCGESIIPITAAGWLVTRDVKLLSRHTTSWRSAL